MQVKIVNIGVMIVLRGLTQPLNAYEYKYLDDFPLLLVLFYPVLVPADLSQRAK
jgi:hypothetical protein